MLKTTHRNKWAARGMRWLAFAALVMPALAQASWWNNQWSYRRAVTLDTGPKGAALQSGVVQVPVLLRLHDGVFRFSDANPDGSDLRFVAEDDKTELKFHVEKYDSTFNLAFVWIAVPQLTPGQPVKLWMYYGNPKAGSQSESRSTYGPDDLLVYHFADRAAPLQDAAGYGNNGTAAAKVDDNGLIASALALSGGSGVALPASASLSVIASMSRTVTFWIKPATAGEDATIISQADASGQFTVGLEKGVPYVSAAAAGSAPVSARAPAALDTNWHHIAVVSGASNSTLFVDGAEVSQIPSGLPAIAAAIALGSNGTPGAAGYAGLLDEFTIAKTARSKDFIRLAALNQGPGDKLVTFGADEVLSTWKSGYVAIILQSVTLDGWVVIGMLMIMALISWAVMVSKARQVSLATRANAAFLEMFRDAGGDFVALSAQISSNLAAAGQDDQERRRKLARRAPLFHVFAAGVQELRERLPRESPASTRGRWLSPQSIEAIRASLDASFVHETESLNQRMVLLTIAISGGPFLGLLGTVVGVMITFAAIAASGDVNINAIAPGIAAALVATVAGLMVAIPALFGYNYLTTRISSAGAKMQVFLDVFIARLAENYNQPAELQAMSA